MTKNERIFRVIAVAGLAVSVYALLRTEVLLQGVAEATRELKQIGVDLRFADIADRFDDEGEK